MPEAVVPEVFFEAAVEPEAIVPEAVEPEELFIAQGFHSALTFEALNRAISAQTTTGHLQLTTCFSEAETGLIRAINGKLPYLYEPVIRDLSAWIN